VLSDTKRKKSVDKARPAAPDPALFGRLGEGPHEAAPRLKMGEGRLPFGNDPSREDAGVRQQELPRTPATGDDMQLLTQAQTFDLLENGKTNKLFYGEKDFQPVVKLFTPWEGATWLLTELDPDDQDLAFGLCDLGQGMPGVGHVSLAELRNLRGPGGLPVELDLWFKADKMLQAYAEEAYASGYVKA
jgi:hypothetical protein